jgi:Tfp pilus assembly protein PilO
MTSNDTRSIALIALGGLAILAALWVLAISPKRTQSAEVRDNVATQQQRLQAAQAQLGTYQAAHKQFPGMLAELRGLDKAVPARAAISSLLRQLQRRANVRDSELRLVALKSAGPAGAPAAGVVAATAAVAPGAIAGPAGLSALPFTFEFTGKYFDLRDILATVRRSVRVKAGDVNVSGRLLTIDGLTFTHSDPASTQTKAVLSATAYIAPDGASTPQPPADAAATTTAGGS